MPASPKLTRHQQIVAEAEDFAEDCYWGGIDPSRPQVARTIEAALGRALDSTEARVAWCAYREQFADLETGRAVPRRHGGANHAR